MTLRNIISIDEEKCNGCGQCVVDCVEAALQVVDGKVKLVKEIYCDGLGACLGSCPTGALKVVMRESDPFDEVATEKHMKETGRKNDDHVSCPGAMSRDFSEETSGSRGPAETRPELTNWPIQLKLAGVKGPHLDGVHLLLAADCTAFSAVNFHGRFIKGRKLLIACPKLDDAQAYYEKLVEIFRENTLKSVTVVRMEVPCCGGLAYIVKNAIEASRKDIPYAEVVIGIKGDILTEGKGLLIPKLREL